MANYSIVGEDTVVKADSEREARDKIAKQYPEFGRNYRLVLMRNKNETSEQIRNQFVHNDEYEEIRIPRSNNRKGRNW